MDLRSNLKAIFNVVIVAIAAICLVGGILAGVYLYQPAPEGEKWVTIAIIDGLTPPGLHEYAINDVQALQIYADRLNEQGGVLDHKIRFVIEDDNGMPEKAVAAFEKLKTGDHVAWFGTSLSTVALGYWDRIRDDGRPWFPYIWADLMRAERQPNAFFCLPYGSLVGIRHAEFLVAQGFKDVVLISSHGAAELNMWEAMEPTLINGGATIQKEFWLARETIDFTPYLFEIQQEVTNIDCLMIGWSQSPAVWSLINQACEMGICGPGTGTPWFSLSGAEFQQGYHEALGDNLQWALALTTVHADVELSALGAELATLFLAKTGREAVTGVFAAFDSIIALTEAWKIAGTFDPEPVIKALEENSIQGTRFMMEFKPGSPDDPTNLNHHQLPLPYYGVQWSDISQKHTEDTVIVWPSEWATGTYHSP